MSEDRCQSCQTPFAGGFCHGCGERKLEDGQRKVSVLFGQLLEEVSSLDGKLFRTAKAFMMRPGELSLAHYRGVRKPYIRPLTLFLLINVLYFLVSNLTDFALPLHDQKLQPYGGWLTAIIENEIATSGKTFDELAVVYNMTSELVAKSIVIISVPFLVPFVWLINPQRRFYLIDHTVFSVHIYSFVLVWPMVLVALNTVIALLKPDGALSLWYPALMLFPPLFIYSFFAQKKMYGGGILVSLAKAFIIFVGVGVSHFIYRFIQFWLVWWQVT
ncbi:MAG: hypothetical protein COB37_05115 [Kordiimonadales bacterium]|nr:MAG: hypothetical protein COB37_05115 [Kordiimonadales bacterium]